MTTIDFPEYVMNVPLTFDTGVKNNIWMEEMSEEELSIDLPKAIREMWEIYSFITGHAFVHLLPSTPACKLQDLVYVSNNGIMLHGIDQATYVGSNFHAQNRQGEEKIGMDLFDRMGFKTIQSPFHFEGEAEMKWIGGNTYVGGYGIRSDIRAFRWMEQEFGIHVIPVKLTDPYLYHLDCSVFPLQKETLIVSIDSFTKKEIKQLEKVAEVIPVTVEQAHTGLTNTVRVYSMEHSKNFRLEEIAAQHGMEVCYFNMEEFLKGGGLLSCMVLNINYQSYQTRLL